MTSAIATRDLTKIYGDIRAVDGIDLQVRTGEIFGFLGPNGAGKSTTIRCLVDLARPTRGSAEVLGLDSHRDSIEINRRMGYLPSDIALYGDLTGREFLDYFANLRGGVDDRVVEALAERFSADLSRRCSEYSSGNRQKVGLIQAFMHEPELVILDEPSTGLDPLVQTEMHALLEETRRDGRTVFLSSHTLSEVERVADRVGIIRHGKLIEVAAIDDLKAKAIRRLELEFRTTVDDATLRSIEGVRDVSTEQRSSGGAVVTVSFDGPIDALLREATELGVVNLHSRDADLEDIFLTYYRDDEPDDNRVPGGSPNGTATHSSERVDVDI
jgi:ABC-2 type transport system ATP-binding protein